MIGLTEDTIATMIRDINPDGRPFGIKPTKVVLAPPWNTQLGKATALRIIIARLIRSGVDAAAYKRELATCA